MAKISAQPYDYALPTDSHLALVIIDMQRDFLEAGGFGEALGNDVGRLQTIVPVVQRLRQAFQARGLTIIHTQEGHRPDLSDCPPSKLRRGKGALTIGDVGPMGRILILGEPGNEIVEALAPAPGEWVITKPGKGAFYQTGLNDRLRSHNITHLIVTGVTTEVCVQSTLREANDRGYECLLVEDATESYFPELKQATIEMIRAQGGIVGWTATAGQVIAGLVRNAGVSSSTTIEEMTIEEMTIEEMTIEEMTIEEMTIEEMTTEEMRKEISFNLPEAASSSLNVRWIHGSVSAKHNLDPDIQVHFYNEHTVILRQNMAVHAEAPFMFLLFGNERVILLDTGATRSPEFFPLRQTVDALIEQWLTVHPQKNYPLVVAHTHLHRDHFEADPQFAGRPNTVMVGKSLAATIEFYGFQDWPQDEVAFDLGRRSLQILATPGHEEAEISIYDPYTHILFAGDLFYPGRLYIQDWEAFVDSIERMISFCDRHPVTHILGCHIEMSLYPKLDYLVRTNYQPYERPLEMTVEQLKSVRAAISEINGNPGIYTFDDYIIYNGVPERYFSYDTTNPEAEPGDLC